MGPFYILLHVVKNPQRPPGSGARAWGLRGKPTASGFAGERERGDVQLWLQLRIIAACCFNLFTERGGAGAGRGLREEVKLVMSRYPEEPAWPSPEAPAGGEEGDHFSSLGTLKLLKLQR